MWWWGDALAFGERKYGEMYAQALQSSGYDYDTLVAATWVSSRVELLRRRSNDSDNVTISDGRGNSRSYTLSRLKREKPELYQRVGVKQLSLTL